jgi:hypothetical protein
MKISYNSPIIKLSNFIEIWKLLSLLFYQVSLKLLRIVVTCISEFPLAI